MVQSMFTPAYREVVEAVVALRKEAGLTQREMATLLNREQSYVGRIETGQRRIDIVELVWICKACGADPDTAIRGLVQSIAGHSVPRRGKQR